MSRDILENTPLPHVSFGDTVLNPLPPAPLECHILFEWPLIADEIGQGCIFLCEFFSNSSPLVNKTLIS